MTYRNSAEKAAKLEALLEAAEANEKRQFERARRLDARVVELEALCKRAGESMPIVGMDAQRLADQLRAAGRGEAVLPRGLVKGPSGDLTEAEVKEILAARPSVRRAIVPESGSQDTKE